ncbi:hypothetical protein MHBO_000459 [Bonamia ostreae]|uniref:Uncharacterized protein n=1 Tax=Bonamia ostreae TaxID=126728 RepID=A0ABV2AFN4_9EUKA
MQQHDRTFSKTAFPNFIKTVQKSQNKQYFIKHSVHPSNPSSDPQNKPQIFSFGAKNFCSSLSNTRFCQKTSRTQKHCAIRRQNLFPEHRRKQQRIDESVLCGAVDDIGRQNFQVELSSGTNGDID